MKRFLKRLATYVIVAGIIGIGIWIVFNTPAVESVVNVKPEIMATSTVEVVEVDPITRAKEEINRISQELDQEETRLLEERAKLKAEYEAKQADLQIKLDSILEARMSF